MAEDTKECPFCAETIKEKAIYCRFCGHYLDGRDQIAPGDTVGGDKTTVGNVDKSLATAVGTGANAEVKFGKDLRDEQYEIALDWEARGRPRMRGFDLAGRDLSELKLIKVDLRNADLHEARFTGANLLGADLSGSDLRGADLRGVTLDREALENDSSAIVVFPGEAIRAKLIEAKYDIHTKWPAGYDPSTAGAVLVDEDGIPASSKDGG